MTLNIEYIFVRHLTQLTITENSLSGVMAYERGNVYMDQVFGV